MQAYADPVAFTNVGKKNTSKSWIGVPVVDVALELCQLSMNSSLASTLLESHRI